MPEYLAPGVYVEETSYRSKSIEGVSTSTAGFVGTCRFGPVRGPATLVTSFEEFRRMFGEADDLVHDNAPTVNHLARAVRAFFENGGKRVYVSRIFVPDGVRSGIAELDVPSLAGVRFAARFPGAAGNLPVQIVVRRGPDALVDRGGGAREIVGLRPFDVVHRHTGSAPLPATVDAGSLTANDVAWVVSDASGNLSLQGTTGNIPLTTPSLRVQKLSVVVRVGAAPRLEEYVDLSTHPDSPRYVARVLRTEDPTNGVEPPYDRTARVWFDAGATPPGAGALLEALLGFSGTLGSGDDGDSPEDVTHWAGLGTGHEATGLASLAEQEDISLVAAPGASALSRDQMIAVHDQLISHCENLRYRFAVLSGQRGDDQQSIRELRARYDSSYAAIYHPWITVPNGPGGATTDLPPDGFVTGIFARSDIERGVHKAPANEVVRGALRFNRHVTTGQQDVLNPLGVNCLRFFEGRGNRVWGARTMSSDPEWTYVNVRRLFIFLERSIDRATQWAVFEPNNELLWLKVRTTVTAFLTDVWRTGALMGSSPEDAFFVRCDRTTMTQGDLDNGRLICLIGVAPTKPAEFVVFRIGQWTADASVV